MTQKVKIASFTASSPSLLHHSTHSIIVPLATRRARRAREAVPAAVKHVTRGARRRIFMTAGLETTVTNALRTRTATMARVRTTSVCLAARRARRAREAAPAAVKRVTRGARRRIFMTAGLETTVTSALRTRTAITGTTVTLEHLDRTRVCLDQA